MIGKEKVRLAIFGNHNLLNLQAAYHVGKELKIKDADFAKAISSFAGAARRLELIAQTIDCNIYRDFAHAPSKVKASIDAVKEQFPNRRLVAVLELHTFSSLNIDFITEYRGAMNKADEAIVFYSNHALELKRMKPLDPKNVKKGFEKQNLVVINERKKLEEQLKSETVTNSNFLFMSSGNYDGMNILNTLNIVL
jgi:UDP-N-acetylmuramate: L-alanyl-gamma-D-glutamyl-meso-diaminopimelate ligase